MTQLSARSLRDAGIARVIVVAVMAFSLPACESETAAPREGRPVRVVTVDAGKLANDVQLSGEI